MNILVVEDNVAIALKVEMVVQDLGYTFVGCAENLSQFIQAIEKNELDLVVLDIDLPGEKDGIEIGKLLVAKKIPIIFITGYKKESFFERAKKLKPVAFLHKPIQNLTLKRTIALALSKDSKVEQNDENVIYLKMNNSIRKINVDEIMFIEVNGNYCYIFTKEKKFILKISLKKIKDKLNQYTCFIQVHKRFILQQKFVKSINVKEKLVFIDDHKIPIGRMYKKDFLDLFDTL